MSKQAIALLQAERDAVLECLRDMGGRATDEQSSTVAEYDEAIAAIQKLMDSQADDLKAYALLFKAHGAVVKERDELASRVRELEAEVLDQCRLNGMGAERESAFMGRVRELEGDAKRWRFLLAADSPTVCTYEEDDQSGEWVPIHPQNIHIVVDAEMATAAALNASKEHL